MADTTNLDALDASTPHRLRQEILAHPDIQALLARHPGQQTQLKACVDGLIQEGTTEVETLVMATKKTFDAATGRVRIFLSYKRAMHADVARSLRKTLQALGGSRIDVFLDEVKIESGRDWLDSIKRGLRLANCLILLVPDDFDEREWPIFEAAFFVGRMLPGERLICLHHPSVAIPRQLQTFQGDKADAAGIGNLLNRLLVAPNFLPGLPSINPDSESFLEEHAQKLARQFSGPTRLRSRPRMNYVKLELAKLGQLDGPEDLLASRVVDSRGLSEMFFFTGDTPCNLGRVLHVTNQDRGRHDSWLSELAECIREEIAQRRGEVPFAKFATPDNRRFFRPVLREIEEDERGVAHRVEIIFGEHLSGITDDPDDLQVIEAVLRLAARMRSEILTRMRRPRRAEDVERVERVLKRIEREAQDEGFRDQQMLLQLFSGAAHDAIAGIYESWTRYRNDTASGKLDRAFATRDAKLCREALDEVSDMNLEFTKLAAQRYADMLTEQSQD